MYEGESQGEEITCTAHGNGGGRLQEMPETTQALTGDI